MVNLRAHILWGVVAALVIGAGCVVYDLERPVQRSLKTFDPDRLAHTEVSIWRASSDPKKPSHLLQMADLLRTEYRFPFARSFVTAWNSAQAAAVFKHSRERRDYERAMVPLVRYYEQIDEVVVEPFDVQKAAELKLEWWIVRRERSDISPGRLARAIASQRSAVYGLPADEFRKHAQLLAEAMTLRDDRAAEGGVREADWQRIDALLCDSFRSLHDVVNRQ